MNAQNTTKTPLQRVVSQYEERICCKWRPTNKFYKSVSINQKRFGMILRGELDMTLNEAHALSEFFKTDLKDLLN